MLNFLMGLSRGARISLGIALALVLFVALNVLASNLLRAARIDLTAQNLYTLSDGTREVLATLDEPVHVRLFLSRNMVDVAPALATYATRVKETLAAYQRNAAGMLRVEVIDPQPFSDGTREVLATLDEPVHVRLFLSSNMVDVAPALATYATRVQETLAAYQRNAAGMLRVEVIDPQPFSDAEDRAVGLGVNPIPAGNNVSVFFGLAATNSTDGRGSIPVFSPEREPFLEYDLTRLIVELGQRGKPVLALFDGIGLLGNPMSRQPEQQVVEQARQFFDVQLLSPDSSALPDDTRVLMLVHPQNLSESLLYAVDQWTLSGGATFVFVDPYAETQQGLRPGTPPPDPSSGLASLFDAWGIGFDDSKVVGDPVNALRSNRPSAGGREEQVPTIQWLGLREDSIASNHPELEGLNAIFLTSAGQFTTTSDKVGLEPLLIASAQAGTVNAAAAGDPGGDPRALMAGLKPLGMRPVLGARVTGELASAFPAGKPEGTPDGNRQTDDASTGQGHVVTSSDPINLVVLGDADMLMDRNWIRRQQVLGQMVPAAFANNGDFVLNIAEQLAGGASLAGLRGRGISYRPFERIDALQREAQARYLDKEQELTKRLRDTEIRLAEMSRKAGEGAALMSDEGTQAIEAFRADLLATRAELRAVQFDLKSDVEALKTRLTGLNVALVPALVALLALLYALRRRKATVPRRTRADADGTRTGAAR